MHPMLPLMVPALLVSTFLVMAFLWYCQEGKKSEDREEHIYVIRGTRQQRELLKHAAEQEDTSMQKLIWDRLIRELEEKYGADLPLNNL